MFNLEASAGSGRINVYDAGPYPFMQFYDAVGEKIRLNPAGSWMQNYLIVGRSGSSSHKLDVTGTTNLSGNTLIEGDLDVTGNITGNQIYAEVWYHNHTATPLTFAVDGLFYIFLLLKEL